MEAALGPVATADLGPTLVHENWPHLFARDTILALAERKMADLYARGIRTVVDLTTVDLGRDIDLILAVARQSPVQVQVATGVWWMPPRFFSAHGGGATRHAGCGKAHRSMPVAPAGTS